LFAITFKTTLTCRKISSYRDKRNILTDEPAKRLFALLNVPSVAELVAKTGMCRHRTILLSYPERVALNIFIGFLHSHKQKDAFFNFLYARFGLFFARCTAIPYS
jgi:hypothetical protein